MAHWPNEIIELFSDLTEIDPDVIIAGGAVRDLDNGVPIKDYDFIMDNRYFTSIGVYLIKHNIGYRVTDSYGCGLLRGLTQCIKVPSLNVDILLVNKDYKQFVDNFDIGFCKCYYHQTEGFVYTEQYKRDKKGHTLTLNPYMSNDKTLHDHVPRLLKKYPSFTPCLDYVTTKKPEVF